MFISNVGQATSGVACHTLFHVFLVLLASRRSEGASNIKVGVTHVSTFILRTQVDCNGNRSNPWITSRNVHKTKFILHVQKRNAYLHKINTNLFYSKLHSYLILVPFVESSRQDINMQCTKK